MTSAARRLLPLLVPALVVGVMTSVLLVVVSELAHLVEQVLWKPQGAWWIVVVLTLGGLFTGLVVQFVPGHAGHDPATEGLAPPSPLPLATVPSVVLALFITLAFGVSLGPEAPITAANIALACGLGAKVLPRVGVRVWTGLALSGTIGALFGTPVAAALMMSEMPVPPEQQKVPLWDRMVAPILAAAAGSLTTHVLNPRLDFSLSVPQYPGFRFVDLVTGCVIAAVGCLIGMVAVYALPHLHRLAHRIDEPLVLLTLGGLILGVLGVIGGRITLFKGLEQMRELTDHAGAYSSPQLLLIIVVKTLALLTATAVGFRGGRIFPASFIGVAVGVLAWALWPDIPLSLAVACGAMGVSVAIARSGWLSLFLGAVLAGSITLVPLLCVAILPAWLIATGRPPMQVAAPTDAPA